MADMRISEDFIIGQASLVNEIEDQRDTYNDALKSAWSDYREELKLLGLTGKEIAAEVAALKSAISDTRMTAEDRAKAEEKADGKDGYLAILSGPRARARVREAKSEPLLTKAAGQAVLPDRQLDASSVENEAAEISTRITEQQDAPHPASDLTASPSLSGQVAPIQPETANEAVDVNRVDTEGVTGGESAAMDGGQELSVSSAPDSAIDSEDSASDAGQASSANSETGKPVEASASAAPLSFADKIRRLRPNCQHPEACRSSGGKAHCGPCGRAAETGSAA